MLPAMVDVAIPAAKMVPWRDCVRRHGYECADGLLAWGSLVGMGGGVDSNGRFEFYSRPGVGRAPWPGAVLAPRRPRGESRASPRREPIHQRPASALPVATAVFSPPRDVRRAQPAGRAADRSVAVAREPSCTRPRIDASASRRRGRRAASACRPPAISAPSMRPTELVPAARSTIIEMLPLETAASRICRAVSRPRRNVAPRIEAIPGARNQLANARLGHASPCRRARCRFEHPVDWNDNRDARRESSPNAPPPRVWYSARLRTRASSHSRCTSQGGTAPFRPRRATPSASPDVPNTSKKSAFGAQLTTRARLSPPPKVLALE